MKARNQPNSDEAHTLARQVKALHAEGRKTKDIAAACGIRKRYVRKLLQEADAGLDWKQRFRL